MVNRIEEHLEKLAYFRAVCQAGSITKASRLLRLSQPSLSRSLKKLEECLDVVLFVRRSSGVELTAKGQLLLKYANDVHQDADRLAPFLSSGRSVLRVGTHEVFRQGPWRGFQRQFERSHPKVALQFEVGRVDDLLCRLRNLELDALVTVRPLDTSGLCVESLSSSHLGFFERPRNVRQKLFTDLGAHFEQFSSIPKVLGERGFSGIYNSGVYSFGEALRLALQGEGVAAIPESLAREELVAGTLVRTPTSVPTKRVGFETCLTVRSQEWTTELEALRESLRKSTEFSAMGRDTLV